MDEGRFNLSKLTEKVRSYLQESLPRLAWVKEFKGAAIPNVPTGTVAAGEMEFVDTSKGADMAVVAFSIYLIDPSSENYWSKTLPIIEKKIEALPCNQNQELLEEGEEENREEV